MESSEALTVMRCLCCPLKIQTVTEYQQHLITFHKMDGEFAINFVSKRIVIEQIMDSTGTFLCRNCGISLTSKGGPSSSICNVAESDTTDTNSAGSPEIEKATDFISSLELKGENIDHEGDPVENGMQEKDGLKYRSLVMPCLQPGRSQEPVPVYACVLCSKFTRLWSEFKTHMSVCHSQAGNSNDSVACTSTADNGGSANIVKMNDGGLISILKPQSVSDGPRILVSNEHSYSSPGKMPAISPGKPLSAVETGSLATCKITVTPKLGRFYRFSIFTEKLI